MPEKPSLLLVSQSYTPRENQKKLWALADHFDLVCATASEVQSMGMTVKLSDCQEERPFKLIGLDTVGDPNSTTKFVFLGLEKVIREHRADIILVETEPWAFLRWQTWLLQRKLQPRALFVEFSWENLSRKGWKGKLLRWVYRAATYTADFAIAGNAAAAELFEQGGLRRNRLLVSPQLGVDEKLFSPPAPDLRKELRENMGIGRGDFVIGFSGRYIEEKGVKDLVAAVEIARSRTGNPQIKLLMLGTGPLREELLELKGQRPWLEVLPPRRHHEVAAFMQTLDLFVLPSKTLRAASVTWAEQFGHVLVEATACGAPSLGSTCGEIPNVIASPDAIFPEGDVSALAERLVYWATHPAELVELGNKQRARTIATYSNAALARKLSDRLKGRLAAEKRSVLWVDPHIEWRSPSMRHPMFALEKLKRAGWEVRAWCFKTDLNADAVDAKRWRRPRIPSAFELFWFTIRANFEGWLYRAIKRREPAAIVHSTGPFYLGANLVSIHFVNALWVKKQMELGFANLKQIALFGLSWIGAFMDYCQFKSSESGRFLCVSDSIADDVRERVHSNAAVETLPNGYDETRFNPETRADKRETTRADLGIRPDETLFIFLSTGHYDRKGFWLAISALSLVRSKFAQKRVKFLVVGGTDSTLSKLRADLAERSPGYDEWIVFAGQQPNPEDFLAASDAMLYPSHFEAFCLAEIEAAAMGIPLLITRHHGAEMILQDGANGLALESNPEAIATRICEFIASGPNRFTSSVGKALTRNEYADRLLSIYESEIRSKEQPSQPAFSATTTMS